VGRPRRPNHLKILSGERPDRINYGEPLPAETTIAPPAELSDAARKIWEQLAPDLEDKGVLKTWDTTMFGAFCESAATYRHCIDQLGTDKLTAPGSLKNQVVNPLWRVAKDCLEMMTRIGGRFGLTPADRASLDMRDETPAASKYGPERLLG
jgi:P27 family predicted phage terminase small subunit